MIMNASKVFCETKTEENQLSAHSESRNKKDDDDHHHHHHHHSHFC
jgi:hypothetical protein